LQQSCIEELGEQRAKVTTNFGSELLAAALAGTETTESPIRHIAELPARPGQRQPWPDWADGDVVPSPSGIAALWTHQRDAAELAHQGRHVVIATGTASGKSLAYQLPILDALARDPRARALYLIRPRHWATTSCAPPTH
jgi:DEAD/DEAH box helicase domain-containing protein